MFFRFKSGDLSKFGILIFTFFLILGVWSYVQAEVSTVISPINSQEICEKSGPVKYFKVINFNAKTNDAALLCVREELSKSTFHKLNFVKQTPWDNGNWQIIYTSQVYTDNNFFWPAYF